MGLKLETKRCLIRAFKKEDLDDFYEYAKMDDVGVHAGWSAHENKETTKEILESFIVASGIEFAIEWKDNHQVIGSFGIHDKKDRAVNSREIGYVLSKDYWGKGIMSEVAERMIQYAFEDMRLDMLTVFHYDYNIKSKSVIEKMGFKYEGTLRKARKNGDGKIVDSLTYSLLKEEWEANK